MAAPQEFRPLRQSQVVGMLNEAGYKQTQITDSTGGITSYALEGGFQQDVYALYPINARGDCVIGFPDNAEQKTNPVRQAIEDCLHTIVFLERHPESQEDHLREIQSCLTDRLKDKGQFLQTGRQFLQRD